MLCEVLISYSLLTYLYLVMVLLQSFTKYIFSNSSELNKSVYSDKIKDFLQMIYNTGMTTARRAS